MSNQPTALETADAALAQAQELIGAGALADALPHLDTALGGFEAVGESYGLIIALKLASETNRDLGNTETALEQVRRAHNLLADLKPDAEQVADFATEVGSIYAELGQLEKSRLWYGQGLTGYREQGRQAEIAHNLICLAGLDRQEGNETAAQEGLAAAYAIHEELGNDVQLMHVRSAMGQGLLATGDAEDAQRALGYLGEALALGEKLGDTAFLGETHQVLALVTAQTGSLEEAQEHLTRAATYFREAGADDRALFVEQLARVAAGKKD